MRNFFIFSSFLITLSLAQAQTHKYAVEEFLHVSFEGREAVKVYRSLDLSEGQLSEGKGKNFRTKDGSLDLSCFNRHYNANEPYACRFVFDLRGLSNQVALKPEAKGMRFNLLNPKTANELYQALLVPEYILEGKKIKILEIESGDVVIDCRLDERRSDAQPECSVFTTL